MTITTGKWGDAHNKMSETSVIECCVAIGVAIRRD